MTAVVESGPCACWAEGQRTNHAGGHCCMRSVHPDFGYAMCGHNSAGEAIVRAAEVERRWA